MQVYRCTSCGHYFPKQEMPQPAIQCPGCGKIGAVRLEELHPEQVDHAGGKAASSKIPPLHLIPTLCLEKTAERFQLGIERKGDKSWNAISNNQEVLTDIPFLLDRLGHIMHHAAKLRDKIKEQDFDALKEDDDASAIVWGGMFLQCAVDALLKQENENDKPSS